MFRTLVLQELASGKRLTFVRLEQMVVTCVEQAGSNDKLPAQTTNWQLP